MLLYACAFRCYYALIGKLTGGNGEDQDRHQGFGRPLPPSIGQNDTRLSGMRRCILRNAHPRMLQDPITGLLPGFVLEDGSISQDAWVRDNVYGILAVWGMALVYKKRSDNQDCKASAFHLEQVPRQFFFKVYYFHFDCLKRVVKLMRGLLFAMMKQV